MYDDHVVLFEMVIFGLALTKHGWCVGSNLKNWRKFYSGGILN